MDSTYCGTTVPADVYTTRGGLRLQFTSDADNQMAGFRLQYSLARQYTVVYRCTALIKYEVGGAEVTRRGGVSGCVVAGLN